MLCCGCLQHPYGNGGGNAAGFGSGVNTPPTAPPIPETAAPVTAPPQERRSLFGRKKQTVVGDPALAPSGGAAPVSQVCKPPAAESNVVAQDAWWLT